MSRLRRWRIGALAFTIRMDEPRAPPHRPIAMAGALQEMIEDTHRVAILTSDVAADRST